MSTKEQYWKYSLITIIIGLGIILARQITPFLGGVFELADTFYRTFLQSVATDGIHGVGGVDDDAPVVQNVDYLLQICRVVVLFIKFQKHDIVGLGLKVYYKSNNKFLEIKCIRMDFILRSAFCGVLPPIAIARLLQPLFRLASKRPRRVREPRHVRALGWWLCPGRLWPLQCFRV